MSQVAAKRKLKISNERIHVTAYFHEQGSVLKGDAEGFCDGFEVEVLLDSEEPVEKVKALVSMARRLCFTEKALTDSIAVTVSQTLNGVTTEI